MMVQRVERKGGSDIHGDILVEILRKLTLVDYLKCRQICRSWRGTIDDAMATKGTSCPHASQFPFLFLFLSTFIDDFTANATTTAILSDITQEDTSYTIPSRTWEGYFDFFFDEYEVTSVQGWLVFHKVKYVENQSCYNLLLLFSNPVSGECFVLPHLPLFPFQYLSAEDVKLVFSSTAPYSSDFLVVASAECGRMQMLAFCKVTDKSWTLISNKEAQLERFHLFVILDWKLYAMSMRLFLSGSVCVFNLRDSSNITFEKLELEPITMLQHIRTLMLARDRDEILLVLHCETICETKRFRVFKLDMCGSRWIEVDDLGDRILLMDYNGFQVLSANEIKLPGELKGGNFVFFVDDRNIRRRHDFRVFSLKDKRITCFPLGRSLPVRGIFRCLWFMPSLW